MNATVLARRAASTTRIVLGLALLLLTPVAIVVSTAPADAAGAATPMVSAGGTHTCAVREDGTAWCWGRGGEGQLGWGLTESEDHPVQVKVAGGAQLTGVRWISAGQQHTCAVRDDGTAWCWGSNAFGQLGDGTTTDTNFATPVQSAGGGNLTGVERISAGETHTCATREDGTAWCWGSGINGRLGNGATASSDVPVQVTFPAGTAAMVDISVGVGHTCAVDAGGGAWCWGDGSAGRLGNNTTTDSNVAVQVVRSDDDGTTTTALTSVQRISAGGSHSCAVRSPGTVWCWGDGADGRLGRGSTTGSNFAVETVALPSPAREVAASRNHTCAALTDARAMCWGNGENGQLGTGGTLSALAPQFVVIAPSTPLIDVTQISVGSTLQIATPRAQSCAHVTTNGGTIRCWGRNDLAQLGDGTRIDRVNPVVVLTATGGSPFLLGLSETVEVVPPGAATPPVGPAVSCSPDVLAVGTEVTCTITGGEPGIDILWRAAVNPTIASEGVTLDVDGSGTFGFTVPASAAGRAITVELVAWTAPVVIGSAVGGPVPSAVKAGQGNIPTGVLLTLFGAMALTSVAGTVLLGRHTLAVR